MYGMAASARTVGRAVASESVGGGVEVGAARVRVRISTGVAAASEARPASRNTSRNGPEPIGSEPNGSSGRASGGIPASRWAGAIGLRRRLEEAAERRRQLERTVSGSTTIALTSRHDSAPGPVYDGSLRTSTVNATSSAVSGSPSCQNEALAKVEGPRWPDRR